MRLRFDHKRTFAPRADIHLALATILTAVLGLLFLAAQAFAVGPVNIPGPLHPDPLRVVTKAKRCVLKASDVTLRLPRIENCEEYVTIVTADESEGRMFIQWWLWTAEGWAYNMLSKPCQKC